MNESPRDMLDPGAVIADPAFPDARLTFDSATVGTKLAHTLAPFGFEAPALRAIRLLRHKAGRRYVVAYDVECGGRMVGVIGKCRAGHVPIQALRRLRAFWKAGFDEACDDRISVPRPIGVWPVLGMWLQLEAPGVPATELLGEAGAERLAARAVEAAHKVHRAGVRAERTHGIADELRILRQKLPEAARALPRLASRVDRLAGDCEHLAAGLSSPQACGIHRDFYSDQVIADGGRLCLIDFDLYCEGDPGLDVGNFLGHVIEQSLREYGRSDALAGAVEAARERYGALAGARNLHAADVYTELTLARHVYLSTVLPGRMETTEPLLELCESRIGRRLGALRTACAEPQS